MAGEVRIASQDTLLEVQGDTTTTKNNTGIIKSDMTDMKALIGSPNPVTESTDNVMEMLLKVLNKPSGGGGGNSLNLTKPDAAFTANNTDGYIIDAEYSQHTRTRLDSNQNNARGTYNRTPIVTENGVYLKFSNVNSLTRLDPDTLEVAAQCEIPFSASTPFYEYKGNIYVLASYPAVVNGIRWYRLNPLTLAIEAYSNIDAGDATGANGVQFTDNGLYHRQQIGSTASMIARYDLDTLERLALSPPMPTATIAAVGYLSGFGVNDTYVYIIHKISAAAIHAYWYNALTLVSVGNIRLNTTNEGTAANEQNTQRINVLCATNRNLYFMMQSIQSSVYYMALGAIPLNADGTITQTQTMLYGFQIMGRTSNVYNNYSDFARQVDVFVSKDTNVVAFTTMQSLTTAAAVSSTNPVSVGTFRSQLSQFKLYAYDIPHNMFVPIAKDFVSNLYTLAFNSTFVNVSLLGAWSVGENLAKCRIIVRVWPENPAFVIPYNEQASKIYIIDFLTPIVEGVGSSVEYQMNVVYEGSAYIPANDARYANFYTNPDGTKLYSMNAGRILMYKV